MDLRSVDMHGSLRCLPCIDSDDIAQRLRSVLDIPRDRAAALGRSALEAINHGTYRTAAGRQINWREAIAQAKAKTCSLPPDATLPDPPPRAFARTTVQVRNETTLEAGQRLVKAGQQPLALNLANGITPGGGFLNGARAQEESLCRASALYATLAGDPMYTFHRRRPEPDSSDWMILSPQVPVFRDDAGVELEAPWPLHFLTAAAPYAPSIGQPRSGDLLHQRIHRALEIATAHGYDTLILGAWGCGAFGNDPLRTARDFRDALKHRFKGQFRDVVFAITDWSPERRFLGSFRDVFQQADPDVTAASDDRLQRFVTAQAQAYQTALAELQSSHKRSHWMWFVLPQLRGLGRSAMAHEFGIEGLDEAQAYLAHPVLGPRLSACIDAIARHRGNGPIASILGDVDALKYRSCLTLFRQASAADPRFTSTPFERALADWFEGQACPATLALLAAAAHQERPHRIAPAPHTTG